MKLEKVLLHAAFLALFLVCALHVKAQTEERLYRIIVKNKYGFIDRSGRVIVEPEYEAAGEFSGGLAFVKKAGKYGYIDVSGKLVIAPTLWGAENFSDGLAVVAAPGLTPDKGIRGYIDKTGRVVLDVSDNLYYPNPFSEGLAVHCRDQKCGYIDKTGKVVIEMKFDAAFGFSEAMAKVRIGRKYGYIDKTGKMMIQPQFPQQTAPDIIGRPFWTDYDTPFRDGLANIVVGEGREWSVIDKTGKIIFTPSPNNYSPFHFSEGLIRFRDKYFSEGFLNSDGSVAIKAAWHTVDDFSEGLAAVASRDNCPDSLDSCWGFIDKTGAVVIKPYFASAGDFKGGLSRVVTRRTDQKDGRMFFTVGYIDKTGKMVWSVSGE